MIKDIKEINLPSYATLSSATISDNDMGDKTIAATVEIEGDVTPDFSYDWEIEWRGERYIQPLRKPQGTKDNASKLATVDLTFQHWAVYQLKRYLFPEMTSRTTGTAIADGFVSSLSLNLSAFVDAFNQVLEYRYGDAIVMQLNPLYVYDPSPTTVEIENSYIWDVLQKMYELYAVRWRIERLSDSKYVIKVGYEGEMLDHIFEYGFQGGLLKYERNVQDPEIKNILYGRGGEKNLPYRYFKGKAEDSGGGGAEATFAHDPDYIPELANIHFSRLHDINFRYYVQGWKDKHYTYVEGSGLIDPGGGDHDAGTRRYDEGEHWAYDRGFTDEKFVPVEYVKSDASIAKYGELEGGLSDNDNVYPTIQNITVAGLGRVDEAVDVEQILSDDVEETAEANCVLSDIDGTSKTVDTPKIGEVYTIEAIGAYFDVPEGMTGTITYDSRVTAYVLTDNYHKTWSGRVIGSGDRYTLTQLDEGNAEKVSVELKVYSATEGTVGEEVSPTNIPGGHRYLYTMVAKVKFIGDQPTADKYKVGCEVYDIKLRASDASDVNWANTFNIWIKDIWQSTKLSDDETDEAFAERIWLPILGSSSNEEAKVVFSTGDLSTSEDYEFRIVKYTYDTSKSFGGVNSMWRLTLEKSDADLESIGLYVPSTHRQGAAGDHFFFIGIDMPHRYTLWAEQLLHDVKTDELEKVQDISPTNVITLDKVRAYSALKEDAQSYLAKIKPGAQLRVADKRFISGAWEAAYIQSVTYTYGNQSSGSSGSPGSHASILPDVEVVLNNEIAPVMSTVATLQGDVSALQTQLGSLSNIGAVVRAIGDKLYLRKDGTSDRSLSPTSFYNLVTSQSFRQGRIGGSGWGLYRDANGNTVFEADRMILRQSLDVTTLVVHQTEWVGGSYIESAAGMKCSSVTDTAEGYRCYFDTKSGSVKNLFRTDDIAYSQTFDAENARLAFYKRKVIAVGDDYIVLSKTIANGEDVPMPGDVIVQYGNYTDANRQYVKIRDVVGGGYERFLEGLDSVNAVGAEYYYAGKEIGSDGNMTSYRLFIGNHDGHYIEFKDNELEIRAKLRVTSGETVENYVSSAVSQLGGGRNFAHDTQYPKTVTWITEVSDRPLSTYKVSGINVGDTVTISAKVASSSGVVPIYMSLLCGAEVPIPMGYMATTTPTTIQGTITIPESSVGGAAISMDNVYLAFRTSAATFPQTIYVSEVMVEKGSAASAWCPRSNDFDYLSQALKQSTTIEGGLVQTALVQVGETSSEGFTPMAGVNGIYDDSQRGGGVAFFSGGDIIDPADASDSDTRPATFGVRMDGTVWAAKNTVRIDENQVSVGDNVVMDKNGISLVTEDGRAFTLTDKALAASDLDSYTSVVTFSATGTMTVNLAMQSANGSNWLSVSKSDNVLYSATKTTVIEGNIEIPKDGIQVTLPIVKKAGMNIIYPRVKVQITQGSDVQYFYLKRPSIGQGESWDYEYTTVTYKLSEARIIPQTNKTVTLMVSIVNPDGSGQSEALSSGKASYKVNARVTPPSANKTIIGNNGISSIWGASAAFLHCSGLTQINQGNYCLKVTATGIFASNQRGADGTWTSLFS